MSDIFREGGYKFGTVTSMTVSTVATTFPYNGTFQLHNAGTGTVYMGIASTLGSGTGSWDIGAGEKIGPLHLTTGNWFLASAARTLKFFQYIY
jgi:hypothetical protein